MLQLYIDNDKAQKSQYVHAKDYLNYTTFLEQKRFIACYNSVYAYVFAEIR